MRRLAVITSSLIATAAAFLGGVGPAFATRVEPIADSGPAGHPVAQSIGLAVWQISLVVAASLVVLAAAATVSMRVVSRRTALRHAIH